MGFLLPVLLLGLAQPADLPSSDSPAQPEEQARASGGSSPIAPRRYTFDEAAEVDRRFDQIGENPADARPNVCLTMRSYYFQRRDTLAPEFVGMTTCSPLFHFTVKKVNRPARLVPAN